MEYCLICNGNQISYKIDIGAQYNVSLAKSLENKCLKPDLQPVNVKLSAYNGSKTGKCSLNLARKNNCFKVSFIIIDSGSIPNLWQLIKKIVGLKEIMKRFSQKFMTASEK